MGRNVNRVLSAGAGLAALALVLTGCAGGGSEGTGSASDDGELTGTVTVLLPSMSIARYYLYDAPAFEAAMQEIAPGITVNIVDAEGSPDTQLSQIETAINQGTDGLLLIAADPSVSGAGLVRAEEAGIPVISYQHEALDGPVAYHLMEDTNAIGKAQAELLAETLQKKDDGPLRIIQVNGNAGDFHTQLIQSGQVEGLQPLIDSGDLEIACEGDAAGWEPSNAQRIVEQCLTQEQGRIDAVLAANDGTAYGAIAAVEGQNLDIPIYGGQNAELQALQYILEGKLVATVLKQYEVMGAGAAKLMVAALKGEAPEPGLISEDFTFDNGWGELPTALFEGVNITAENIDAVVEAGVHTKEEICAGITDRTGYCDS